MEELFVNTNYTLKIGRREVEIKIESIKAEEVDINVSPSSISYHIHEWLPLNEKHNRKFHSTESVVERIQLLEQILTGNILSLLKGLDIFIDFQLQPIITDFTIRSPITYKHIKLTNIDLSFNANINLPQQIGIGKHSSMGAGVLTKKTKTNL